MGYSGRAFVDLRVWIWGTQGRKWRVFGDVGEWTWGSGQFGATEMLNLVRPKAGAGLIQPLAASRYPKSPHSLGRARWVFPKDSHRSWKHLSSLDASLRRR